MTQTTNPLRMEPTRMNVTQRLLVPFQATRKLDSKLLTYDKLSAAYDCL